MGGVPVVTMGIDIGSTSSKAVLLEDGERILAKAVVSFGIGTAGPRKVYESALAIAGITRNQVDYIMSTGYGRNTFTEADCQISELSCHARGMVKLVPGAHTIIDIGGQDAKVLQINEDGKLANFVMNDKCAAGTGRFLDVMARVLALEVGQLGELSAKSQKELGISNVCTVFAESEVISHLAAEEPVPDIVAGIHRSVAKRAVGLGSRIGFRENVAMSGGVALNIGVIRAIEAEIKSKVYTHPDAQLAGAYGAAILAHEKIKQ